MIPSSGVTSAAEADLHRGERLRLALQELGPVSIKFGQLLSTRRDLLPDDVADELSLLQDKVAPFHSAEATAAIEHELGRSIDQVFKAFDQEPLAAASVAQVHSVTLADGESAVIKVLRPGIEKQIVADIRLLKRLAKIIDSLSDELKRLRLPEVIEDYEATITAELDLRHEAANASLLKKNTSKRKLVYVPTVFWDYSSPRVMVSEKISGIPIGDIPALKEAGVNMKTLAERGVEIFFSQVFDDCFFHADMHPGNIFVDVTHPQSLLTLRLTARLLVSSQGKISTMLRGTCSRSFSVTTGWLLSSISRVVGSLPRHGYRTSNQRFVCYASLFLTGHSTRSRWDTCWLICSGQLRALICAFSHSSYYFKKPCSISRDSVDNSILS